MTPQEIEQQKKRNEEYFSAPFSPAPGAVQADLRAAIALEYIAAQLGMINANLGKLVWVVSSSTRG